MTLRIPQTPALPRDVQHWAGHTPSVLPLLRTGKNNLLSTLSTWRKTDYHNSSFRYFMQQNSQEQTMSVWKFSSSKEKHAIFQSARHQAVDVPNERHLGGEGSNKRRIICKNAQAMGVVKRWSTSGQTWERRQQLIFTCWNCPALQWWISPSCWRKEMKLKNDCEKSSLCLCNPGLQLYSVTRNKMYLSVRWSKAVIGSARKTFVSFDSTFRAASSA